jgi:thiosulfate/3-mercaptopyruvate sulfurtransferase
LTASNPLVDARWLAPRVAQGQVCVLDASWRSATAGRDARAEFEAGHIPSARFLDLVQVADLTSDLAHTLLSPAHFAACAAQVGVRRDRTTVVYDNAGMAPSARAWWMLTAFGYTDAHVLDGGLRAWVRAGGAVQQGMPRPLRETPEELPPPDLRRVADYQTVQRAIAAGQMVLDARSAARFRGEAAEPVAGIPSGHIEGAINLPYQQLLDEATGCFAPASVLREKFEAAGVNLREPVVCSCGSGVTACVLALALETLGHRAVAVYDGSWTDWARRNFQEVYRDS